MAHVRSALVLLAVLAMSASERPVLAQAPPLELYAVSHLFALPTATTTRLFGMGGFVTCIQDDGFGNPAFAGTLEAYHTVGRYSSTDFDSGLKLKGEQCSVAIPLKKGRKGLQITGFRLKSDPAVPVGLPPGAPAIGYDEWDLAIHYGQRVGRSWVVGIGLSPVFHNSTDFRLPGPPGQVAHFRTTVDEGCRLGALYQFEHGGWAGLVYDKYHEDLTATGPMIPGSPVTARYSSEEIIIGVSQPITERVLGAVEWQQLTTEGNGTKVGDSGFRVGIEAIASDRWTVRLGTNDGAFCAGLGYGDSDWSVQYAFMKDWNDDSVGAIFGGSDTHQLELTYCW